MLCFVFFHAFFVRHRIGLYGFSLLAVSCRAFSFLVISSDVQICLAGSLGRQAVDQPGVGVEVEDDGSVGCEEGFEVALGHAVWVAPTSYACRDEASASLRAAHMA